MVKKYAAYAWNMDEWLMENQNPGAKLLGTGEIKNYRLMFKGDLPLSYATIEEYDGYAVPVVLWEIDEETEKRFDRGKGFLINTYKKKYVEVETAKGAIGGVLVYAIDESYPLNSPDLHYCEKIWEAYEKFGFDTKKLAEAIEYSNKNWLSHY